MSVSYDNLGPPKLVTQSSAEVGDSWTAVWRMSYSTQFASSSHVVGLGNLWVYVPDATSGGAPVKNAVVVAEEPVEGYTQPQTMSQQALIWNEIDRIQPGTDLAKKTRIASYKHSSFLPTNLQGVVDVHAWINEYVYVQIVCTGQYHKPHPSLSKSSTDDTWMQQQENDAIGLIPYLFASTKVFPGRAGDWVLAAGGDDRVQHNVCLIPKYVSFYPKNLVTKPRPVASAIDEAGTTVLPKHAHDWSEITNTPDGLEDFGISVDNFATADHSHNWTTITGKPTTFTPTSHKHSWTDLTNVPTTFAPSTH